MEKEEKKGAFKVTDKRRFTESGEARSSDSPARTSREEQAPEMPRSLDFATFVLSLATSAQVHLGAIPSPATEEIEKNLPLAGQTIDILGILQEKTKGNLSQQEERLLTSVLYDLRMMFVDAKE